MAEKVPVIRRCRIEQVDKVKVVHSATASIKVEDWRRLVKEGKDAEFMAELEKKLKDMGYTEKCGEIYG